MEYSALPPNSSNEIRPDAGRLWAGGFATAVVAALIAFVGVLICRWTLGIPILAPQSDGVWGNASTGYLALAAALVALAATGLLYLLMLATPQPGAFMKWILGLITLAAVVYPFSTGAPWEQKIATAVVLLVIGVAIASLLNEVASRAVKRVSHPNVLRGGYGPGGPGGPGGNYGRGGYNEPPPRGYDDRGGYGRDYDDRGPGYGRPGYDRGPGYDRPGYDPRYDQRDGRGGYDGRGEEPTRQYPPRDRWS